MKVILTIATLLSCFLLFISSATAKVASKIDKQLYMVVKETPIRLGDAKAKLIKQLGQPQHSELIDLTNDQIKNPEQVNKWVYPDGLTFIAVVDPKSEQLTEATISSFMPLKDSYMVIHGDVNYLNAMSIEKLEETYAETYRCLSFFEQDGLGWLDYTIKDNNSSDSHITFSALNYSDHSLNTLEGQIASKISNVDSITLGSSKAKFSNEIYCKQWFEK